MIIWLLLRAQKFQPMVTGRQAEGTDKWVRWRHMQRASPFIAFFFVREIGVKVIT